MINALPRAAEAASRRPVSPSHGGFALLVVLATLIPIALLCVGLVWLGRSDLRVAAASRGSAQAEAVADAAVFEAAFHLTDPATPWPANGHPITLRRFGANVTLCIVNEAGKINPNLANPGLMAALFLAVGLERENAARLAAAIYAWRTRGEAVGTNAAPAAGRSFADIRELSLVPGVTPAVLRRIQPYLTVLTDDQPDPRAAPPLVLVALESLLGTDPITLASPVGPRTVQVVAEAVTADGFRFVRRSALRLGRAGEETVRVLTWGAGDLTTCTSGPAVPVNQRAMRSG